MHAGRFLETAFCHRMLIREVRGDWCERLVVSPPICTCAHSKAFGSRVCRKTWQKTEKENGHFTQHRHLSEANTLWAGPPLHCTVALVVLSTPISDLSSEAPSAKKRLPASFSALIYAILGSNGPQIKPVQH